MEEEGSTATAGQTTGPDSLRDSRKWTLARILQPLKEQPSCSAGTKHVMVRCRNPSICSQSWAWHARMCELRSRRHTMLAPPGVTVLLIVSGALEQQQKHNYQQQKLGDACMHGCRLEEQTDMQTVQIDEQTRIVCATNASRMHLGASLCLAARSCIFSHARSDSHSARWRCCVLISAPDAPTQVCL